VVFAKKADIISAKLYDSGALPSRFHTSRELYKKGSIIQQCIATSKSSTFPGFHELTPSDYLQMFP
jgi:hypothetical protein